MIVVIPYSEGFAMVKPFRRKIWMLNPILKYFVNFPLKVLEFPDQWKNIKTGNEDEK